MTTLTTDRAKARAKTLRSALADINHDIAHGQALDLIARLEGLRDWNALSARLEAAFHGPIPRGWQIAGDAPQHYDMGAQDHGGTRAAFIRLKPDHEDSPGFGTLMQKIEADRFRGKRIALTARLASEGVTGAATIWLRADGADRRNIAFDNLESEPVETGPLRGTQGWTERRIVLDIPDHAASLNFGFYLRGAGAVWCAGAALEETDAPTTASGPNPASAPINMDFAI